MHRGLVLALVLILAVPSLMMVGSASAQSIPKPSVPDFSIRYVEHPFDVAPSFQIDPYSGQNITIQEGHRIQNRSIELVIKNQPFTSSKDSNGNKIELFYNVSSKGYFGNTWYYYPTWLRTLPVTASNNEYTILSFGLDVNYEDDNQYGFWYGDLSTGDQVDFRVQALIGYYNYPLYNIALEYNTFTGEESDWSSIQTITIPTGSVSTSTPNPTLSPTTLGSTSTITPTSPNANDNSGNLITLPLNILIIIIVAIVILAVTLSVLLFRSRRKTANITS